MWWVGDLLLAMLLVGSVLGDWRTDGRGGGGGGVGVGGGIQQHF